MSDNLPLRSGMLVVELDYHVESGDVVRGELRQALHGNHTFRRIEQRCHTYSEKYLKDTVQVRCCITNHRENECCDQKSKTLMKPMENTVCHFVEHKWYGHQCGTGNCIVLISLEAAPVKEYKHDKKHNAVELTCIVAHHDFVIESLHESIFLLVQAEEQCHEKEREKEFYSIENLYHKM